MGHPLLKLHMELWCTLVAPQSTSLEKPEEDWIVTQTQGTRTFFLSSTMPLVPDSGPGSWGQLQKMLEAVKGGVAPPQEVILLLGQGGVGKSELLKVVKAVTHHCFGSDLYIAMAPSNTAARCIGGDTIHSSVGITGKLNRLDPRHLNKTTTPMKERWEPVQVLALDEVSLWHCEYYLVRPILPRVP